PNEERHVMDGRWLGAMQLATPDDLAETLPDRGLGHYFHILQDCRASLQLLSRTALAAEDMMLVCAFIWFCEQLAAQWQEIENACEPMPRTLVHGDLAMKNVRIREGATGCS